MATYRRSYDDPSEGLWSCTPDGVCRFIPNNNNHHHQQQQQGYVMKFETSFDHVQPSRPNHGLAIKDPPKTRAGEEFSQPPIERFQIPISSRGHQDDKVVFADNKPIKQYKEREPTYSHGHGSWDGPPHQFIEKNWPNNNEKGDYWTKEATPAPWTPDPRWISKKPSDHDNRLSKPVKNIDEAMEHLKELAAVPQHHQVPSKEAENMHANNNANGVRQQPHSYNSYRDALNTITSTDAARKYKGHLVN